MGFDEDGDAIYGDRSMKNHSYYIQDDWKLSPAITLSGGLRHDKPNGDGSSPNMDSHTSKSYKLSFDLTKKDTFYAGRSDFYILPSLYQLYDENTVMRICVRPRAVRRQSGMPASSAKRIC